MSSHIEWVDNTHILLMQHWDTVTLSDLIACNKWATDLIEQATHPIVHIIVDVRDLESYPTSLSKMIRATTVFGHAKVGCVATVTTEKALSYLTRMTVRLNGHARFRQFRVLDDAVSFLQARDLTLPKIVMPIAARKHHIPDEYRSTQYKALR